MQVSDFITHLNQQGVRLWAERDTLRINAPKGTLTTQLQTELVAHKSAILEFLRCPSRDAVSTAPGLSLATIGRLIGNSCSPSSSVGAQGPMVDPEAMAKRLKVTFRPPPQEFSNQTVLAFRDLLEQQLKQFGVQIVSWTDATREFDYPLPLPFGQRSLKTRVVKSHIDAVIDVERPANRHLSCLAEHLYRLYSQFLSQGRRVSFVKIAQLTGWAEDHVMQRLEDPTATQVILITELDKLFADAETPYQQKIAMGVKTLVSHFSEIVIGVSREKISILNMNLSDAHFSRNQLEKFVFKSLIPKIYVPIAPLPLGQFELGTYVPTQSNSVAQLIKLSRAMATTGLLPAGFKLAEVIDRKSHRDIVDGIVNGRTGVSYGFVAYAEPPIYRGAPAVSAEEWQWLSPVEGLDDREVRQNDQGRRYLKTRLGEETFYKQIPDIWLVCSRSGANKTDLQPDRDVLRLGLTNRLQLQFPEGIDPAEVDIKPSYDTYVMVAIALAAALYTPELVVRGAPIVHFHGYPARAWFEPSEAYAGVDNPSVPCGTFESGVFNFLSIHQLADEHPSPLSLAALIEPDHGTNIIAPNLDYLLARLHQGLADGLIELGGKHFPSLSASPVVVGPSS
ncbi:MAG: hypothetical protein WBA99_13150 [Nodosilinea sp.]